MKVVTSILTGLGIGWLLLGFLYCFANKAGRSGLFDPITFSLPFIPLVVVGVTFAIKGQAPSAAVRLLVLTGITGLALGPFVEMMGIMTTHTAMVQSGKQRNPFAEILLIGFATAFVGALTMAVRMRPSSPRLNPVESDSRCPS